MMSVAKGCLAAASYRQAALACENAAAKQRGCADHSKGANRWANAQSGNVLKGRKQLATAGSIAHAIESDSLVPLVIRDQTATWDRDQLDPALRAINAIGKPKPEADPKILGLARDWFDRFRNADIDRTQLDAVTDQQLTDDMVTQEAKVLKPFGDPIRFEYIGSEQIAYATSYDFLIYFRAGRILERIAFGKSGKIAGINFQTFLPR